MVRAIRVFHEPVCFGPDQGLHFKIYENCTLITSVIVRKRQYFLFNAKHHSKKLRFPEFQIYGKVERPFEGCPPFSCSLTSVCFASSPEMNHQV